MYSFEERYRPLRRLPGRRPIYVAQDQLLTRQVVIKEVDRQGVLQRREVAALLRLELPGVVRLWDQERVGDRNYLILDYVEGDSFPGCGRAEWEPLVGPTVALLRVLKRIHAAGVIHRDLKPEHVRMRGQDVVLIDFGAAGGPGADAGGPKEEGGAGTYRYLAPEALIDAENISGNADLYALGVMLYEALAGVELHGGPDFQRRRLRGDHAAIEELRPDLPEVAVRLLRGLLQSDPEERLPHAEAALELLGFPAQSEVEQVLAHWKGRSPSPEDLKGLFRGPERIFGKRSRALALLLQRAPARLRAEELSAWLAAGRAAWVDGSLDLSTADRAWLAEMAPLYQPPPSPAPLGERLEELLARIQLCWPGATAEEVGANKEEVEGLKEAGRVVEEDGRLWALCLPWGWAKWGRREREGVERELAKGLSVGDPRRLRLLFSAAAAEDLLQELRETAMERVIGGDLGGGLLRAELGLRLCRSLEVDEEPLLKCWVNAALSESSPQMLRRALVECQRSVLEEHRVDSLKSLVQCAIWTKGGESGRALGGLESLHFEEEWLDRWVQGYRVEAAQQAGEARLSAVLGEAEQWGHRRKSPSAAGDVAGWLALGCYRRGENEKALELLKAAVAGKRAMSSKLSSLSSLCVNLLELRRFEEAEERAEVLRRESEKAGFPVYVAVGEWVGRSVGWREGKRWAPDEELVLGGRALGADLRAGQLALTEAAFAWRLGERRSGARLAEVAVMAWKPAGGAKLAMAEALQTVCSEQKLEEDLLQRLRRELGGPTPGMALQGLGLLWVDGRAEVRRLGEELAVSYQCLAPVFQRGIRELVDLEEVFGRLASESK